MKVFVLKKSTLVLCALCLAAATLAFPVITDSIETSSSAKELPIYSVERSDKKIAVTFDSAWNDADIDEIISVLSAKNCPATFFVTGSWAEKYPESLKKLKDAGHEIGSHSYDHTLYSTLSKDEIKADIEKCDEIIKGIIGSPVSLVRAPSGDYTNASILAARECGKTPIQWDVDSLDWKELSENEMKERIADKVASGSILLFHNGTPQTAQALPALLDSLIAEGYQFTTVSDLIYKDGFYIDSDGKQCKSAS